MAVHRHHDFMIDFTGNGKTVRIERRYAAVVPVNRKGKDGKPLMTKAGKPITDAVLDMDEKGVLRDPKWVVYELVDCQPFKNEDGEDVPNRFLHPWHGEQTSEAKVWMPIGEGTEGEARAIVERVTGKQ